MKTYKIEICYTTIGLEWYAIEAENQLDAQMIAMNCDTEPYKTKGIDGYREINSVMEIVDGQWREVPLVADDEEDEKDDSNTGPAASPD